MTRLLTEHDGAEMARILRTLADDLEEGTRRRGNITRANTWDGNLKGANLDPGRGSEGGDPTGEAATSAHHWTSTLGADIARTADATIRAATGCTNHIRRIPAPVESTDETDAITARIALAQQNIKAGDCDCCGRTCTGDRDDRLTHLIAAWTYWTQGEERENRHERDVCSACRMSWSRAKDRGDDFLEWERHRRTGLDRESA